MNATTRDRRFYVSLCNASEIEPEALADFRLNDSGDRLASASGSKNKVVAFSEKCRKKPARSFYEYQPMSTVNFHQPITCSATRAVKSVFNGPNWTSNLLWLTIAALLQSFVVGSIFMFGYGASLLQARAGLPDRNSPDIDSNRLGDYFMRGLWPFLVYLVASMVVSIILVPFMMLFVMLMAVGAQMGDVAAIAIVVLVVPLVICLSLLMAILLGPITIRAMICQDFQKSFDIGWCMSFIKLTFWEVAISALVFAVMGTAIYLAGFAMLCVGIFPALGLLSGAAMHLLAQWYELFLSRGGEPVEPGADTIIEANVV